MTTIDSRRVRTVLRYCNTKVDQGTIRRAYLRWRLEKGMPERCDNVKCVFHTQPLEWNGIPLKLILDHCDGNRYDNSPANIRLLCPNCDSQLPTRGGANRGRVRDRTEDGYTLVNRDSSRIVAATGRAAGTSTFRAVGSAVVSKPVNPAMEPAVAEAPRTRHDPS
jgi:hypothetical protein